MCVTVFALWPTLTYFWYCDIQLNDISKIICISKTVTTTVKPPSKLVDFEVLLASLPTNMTFTLWRSVKVAWPNFQLSVTWQVWELTYGFYTGQIYKQVCSNSWTSRSHSSNLDLLLWLWHTFKEKSLKAHICSYSDLIVHTHTWSWGYRWHRPMWPWPSKKRS